MKFVSWNCNGALRNKTGLLDQLDADILVIQECEDPAQIHGAYEQWAGNYLWRGKSKHKGIGVFARKDHRLRKLDWTGEFALQIAGLNHRTLAWNSEDLELFLSVMINHDLPLLAVWTKQASSKNFGYIGQFWLYMQIHKQRLRNPNQIICGDFNSNKIWDENDRLWNHSDVVAELNSLGIRSLYHEKMLEQQGEENCATFFLHRKNEKPYHIDYVFVSEEKLQQATLNVLNEDYWLNHSDHIPIEFALPQ